MKPLILLICLSILTHASDWTLSSPELMTNLHAAGRTVVAWNGGAVTASFDGGHTWLPSHFPLADYGDGSGVIRTLRAAPDGTVWLLSSTGKVLVTQRGEGWTDWSKANRMNGVSMLAIDGAGTAWLANGMHGQLQAVVNGQLDPSPKGTGIPIITLANGLVVIAGNGLAIVDTNGTRPIAWKGDREDLPKPQQLARATTALDGETYTQEGTHWTLKGNRIGSSEQLDNTRVISIAQQGATHYLLATYEGKTLIMEKRRSGWGAPTDVGQTANPADATAFTVTDRTYVVTTPRGIAIYDRER